MAINKGLALVSVADVLFFNPVTDAYIGEGFALTDSTITQEVNSIEHRGGYLNALLFDIKTSKNVTVALTSATFKMEYLAFQTGTPIISGQAGVYKFDECVSFTNGIGTTVDQPVGDVYVRMPNGTVSRFTPTGKQLNIGMATFNGSLQVVYKYNKMVDSVTIDTKTQPLLVKAVMRVHVLTQDGVEGYIQITVPRLKFNGSITLNMTADAVSTFDLSGTAQEYTDECGEGYYADAKYIAGGEDTTIAVENIVASPNVITLAPQEQVTANIIGVRSQPYANVVLDNTACTFSPVSSATADVTAEGVIKAKQAGETQIIVSYEGLQDIIAIKVEG